MIIKVGYFRSIGPFYPPEAEQGKELESQSELETSGLSSLLIGQVIWYYTVWDGCDKDGSPIGSRLAIYHPSRSHPGIWVRTELCNGWECLDAEEINLLISETAKRVHDQEPSAEQFREAAIEIAKTMFGRELKGWDIRRSLP